MDDSTAGKTNLLGMTRAALRDFFVAIGEAPFRAHQVMKWMYHLGVTDFSAMTNLNKPLQVKLAHCAEIIPPEVVSEKISTDGTGKWVIKVTSGSCIEAVLIPEGHRGTLCVSSQAGCSLDCSFCSTGKQGFHRNLSAAEIIGQVWIAAKALGNIPHTRDRKITNVVFMGMGEPLLNFDNVIASIALIMDDLGYGLSKRRVTLSTSGVVPYLNKLGQYTDCALAVSLHAPDDALRSQLVPINRKYPIKTLLDSALAYMQGLDDKGRVMTIEYTLIADINDRLDQANALADLLRTVPCKINLIPFNPFPGTHYQRPSNNQVRRFQEQLQKAGFNTTVRKLRGGDIDAACGQLAGNIHDRTRRSERYLVDKIPVALT